MHYQDFPSNQKGQDILRGEKTLLNLVCPGSQTLKESNTGNSGYLPKIQKKGRNKIVCSSATGNSFSYSVCPYKFGLVSVWSKARRVFDSHPVLVKSPLALYAAQDNSSERLPQVDAAPLYIAPVMRPGVICWVSAGCVYRRQPQGSFNLHIQFHQDVQEL